MENELEKSKKAYELAVVLKDGAAEKAVTDLGLEIFYKEDPKVINLAYSIKKHQSGVLFVYHFWAYPENVAAIQKNLDTHPDALRVLLITPPIIVNRKKQELISKIDEAKVEIKPPKTEEVTNEVLEQTLEKILE